METIQRRILALFMSLLMGLVSVPASAEDALEEQINNRPSAAAMVLDALIARPSLVALTAGGTIVYVFTLPFSALGGNAGEAGRTLVVGPAKSAFMRCLGCTKAQDEWKNRQATIEESNK
jgi:hypothetical protein